MGLGYDGAVSRFSPGLVMNDERAVADATLGFLVPVCDIPPAGACLAGLVFAHDFPREFSARRFGDWMGWDSHLILL
jgi:hypothetical protein